MAKTGELTFYGIGGGLVILRYDPHGRELVVATKMGAGTLERAVKLERDEALRLAKEFVEAYGVVYEW